MTDHPRDVLESLQREVERMFHDLVYRQHPAAHFAEPKVSPPTDLVVTRQGARVLLELAGVPRESIRATVRGNLLEVSARRDPPQEPGGAHYHRAEIYFGEFRRTIELPWEADGERVEAFYKDGMLEIRVRRAVPVPRASTQIAIERQEPVEEGDGGSR
jgi:HSP20 family protein